MFRRHGLLVVLCISGIGFGAGLARADSGRRAPDAGYVATPVGFIHQDCVFEVEDGATVVNEDDGSLRIEKDGAVIAHRDKCTHEAHISNIGDVTALNTVGAPASNWVEAAWVQAPDNNGMAWFNRAEGRFTVPAPPAQNGALLYFFNSLESGGSQPVIIQPVLQYGHGSGNSLFDPGNYWAIASWYVTNNSGLHSPLRRVNPGDVVTGTMTASACASNGNCAWTIIAETDTQRSTLNTSAGPYVFNSAQPGVFEAYRVSNCRRTPTDGAIVFTDTYLYQPGPGLDDFNEMALNQPWDTYQSPQTPDCGYNITNFERGTTLFY
jgi:hypothetical protein